MGEISAASMQPHVSLFHLQVRSGLRRRGVEWQPDGSHNKTVIERYVIVTDSSLRFMLGKSGIGDTLLLKKEEKEPLLIKK